MQVEWKSRNWINSIFEVADNLNKGLSEGNDSLLVWKRQLRMKKINDGTLKKYKGSGICRFLSWQSSAGMNINDQLWFYAENGIKKRLCVVLRDLRGD